MITELKQPRRRRQQEPHKLSYLTMKNNSFARFARAFSIFSHFADVFVLSTRWNDLFCSCVDDVSIWWQMLIFFSYLLSAGCYLTSKRLVIYAFSAQINLFTSFFIKQPLRNTVFILFPWNLTASVMLVLWNGLCGVDQRDCSFWEWKLMDSLGWVAKRRCRCQKLERILFDFKSAPSTYKHTPFVVGPQCGSQHWNHIVVVSENPFK